MKAWIGVFLILFAIARRRRKENDDTYHSQFFGRSLKFFYLQVLHFYVTGHLKRRFNNIVLMIARSLREIFSSKEQAQFRSDVHAVFNAIFQRNECNTTVKRCVFMTDAKCRVDSETTRGARNFGVSSIARDLP